MTRNVFIIGLAAVLTVTACGGKKGGNSEESEDSSGATLAPAQGGVESPAEGRSVVTVMATTEADGTNRFVPSEITAHEGDVLRFTLGMGVHNVNFLPDSNTVKSGLPAASPMLQLPGQTYDIKVTMQEGKYYFQCDPHAALGMKGWLTVKN